MIKNKKMEYKKEKTIYLILKNNKVIVGGRFNDYQVAEQTDNIENIKKIIEKAQRSFSILETKGIEFYKKMIEEKKWYTIKQLNFPIEVIYD